jgi:hypothetical protein
MVQHPLFQEFLKGSTNTLSSKRLLGVTSGIIFLLAGFLGAMVCLFAKQYDHFINIILIIGGYSAGLLGAGLFEKGSKLNSKKTVEPN